MNHLVRAGTTAFLALLATGIFPTSYASSKKRTVPPESEKRFQVLFEEFKNAEALLGPLCKDLKAVHGGLRWKLDPCAGVTWQVGGLSVNGRPLVFAEFGDPASSNTTLIFSAVHGDEVTPIYLGFRLAQWMKEHASDLKGVRVIVAPLVNPDSFLSKPRTRTNARGVDINRNFATRDWGARAIAAWKVKYKSDPRRNPGRSARSEPETVFQEELIRRIKPQKILSIHAPLNFMDYDGPTSTPLSLARFSKEYVRECLKLRAQLKATSSGFFPGSLGNFSGQELGIPTLTLELPSADPAKAVRYWETFSKGIHMMIDYAVPVESISSQSPPAQG